MMSATAQTYTKVSIRTFTVERYLGPNFLYRNIKWMPTFKIVLHEGEEEGRQIEWADNREELRQQLLDLVPWDGDRISPVIFVYHPTDPVLHRSRLRFGTSLQNFDEQGIKRKIDRLLDKCFSPSIHGVYYNNRNEAVDIPPDYTLITEQSNPRFYRVLSPSEVDDFLRENNAANPKPPQSRES